MVCYSFLHSEKLQNLSARTESDIEKQIGLVGIGFIWLRTRIRDRLF
jgi:hypothetical protein